MCNFELSELAGGSYAWIDNRLPGVDRAGQSFHRSIRINQNTDRDHGMIETWYRDEDDVSCFCYTHERPKVEYDYCWVDDDNGLNFSACVNEMVSGGWYPLGGISVAGPGNLNQGAQAFWRWAE